MGELQEMDIEVGRREEGCEERKKEVMKLRRWDSEPNLWKVVARDEEPDRSEDVRGMVMTYVDDLFLVGDENLVQSILGKIQGKWKTSEPERVSEVPVRFLGLEVSKKEEKGEEVWFLTQRSYAQDLFNKEEEEVRRKKIPIFRDAAAELLGGEEGISCEDIRGAQKVTGELLWLLTRSRPDLMYVMARMCSQLRKWWKPVIR